MTIQIFENGVQKDLNRYTGPELVELQKALLAILPQNPDSAVLYDVQICEIHKGWRKPPQTTLELVAYTTYKVHGPNLKKISVPPRMIETFTQKRHRLSPKQGLAVRWPETVEAEFV